MREVYRCNGVVINYDFKNHVFIVITDGRVYSHHPDKMDAYEVMEYLVSEKEGGEEYGK